MQYKIKSLLSHPYTQQLNDVRAWGLIVFAIITLMVTWSGIKSVQTNYGLQRQISTLEQQNQVQNLENANLKLQNQYLNTNQFLELAARSELGKAAPGEQELIVPKNVALAHTVSLPTTKNSQATVTSTVNKPTYQKNFEAWIDFFLHRPHSD